jgi:CheY-like chemotaxis protein
MPQYKMLIVDDDATFVVFLRDILESRGYQVHAARNGPEGLEKARQKRPDLILLDVMMPQMDGYEVCRRLKEDSSTAQIPVLMLTAKGQVKEKVKGLNIGADDYLPKPCDKEELEARIEALLRRFPRRFPLEDPKSVCTFSLLASARQRIHTALSGADTFECDSANPLDIGPHDVGRYDRRIRNASKADDWRFQVKEIGRDLYASVFGHHPEVAGCYNRACGKVSRERDLRIVLKSPGEFLRLPFEFLYDDPDYLALRHPLSRFVVGVHTTKAPLSARLLNTMMDKGRKLRILLVASNTDHIDGVDQEVAGLHDRLRKLVPDSGVEKYEIVYLPTEKATYERVRQELRRCKYHVLHYAGHGRYDERSVEESCLYFWEKENRQGKVVAMKAAELALLLRDSALKFAYLSCCSGAATGEPAQLLDDDFLGLADGMIRAGVPSVLGLRWPVSDEGAQLLASSFYESLFTQGNLDVALLEARCRVAERERNEKAWISPILIAQG